MRGKRNKDYSGISEIENVKAIVRTNETKSWFLGKINKIDKPVTRLTEGKKEGGHNKLPKSGMKKIISLLTLKKLNDYKDILCVFFPIS